MTQAQNSKQYDLEKRCLEFARNVRFFIKGLSRTIGNIEDGKQLIRSSGSVGANYIEANESLSKKDFVMRAKICRKEAKESIYWLKLIDVDTKNEKQRVVLEDEVTQLMKIFGSIIEKCK